MPNPQPILYLTYDGLTDPLGQSQVLPYITGLSKQGYSFHIISFEKPDAHHTQKATIQAIADAHGITWHPCTYHKSPPVLSAIYDLYIMGRLARQLHSLHHFNSVWCRSYLPGLIGMSLQRRFGVKFIFDMRGFWPDERIEGGTWPQHKQLYRWVYRYFKHKEKQMLATADHVVVLTHKAKVILESGQLHHNPVPKAITVIPCCVDTDHFDPQRITPSDKANARQQLSIGSDSKVLVYAGSVGTWYMLAEMLDHYKQLCAADASWRFLLITREPASAILPIALAKGIDSAQLIIAPATRQQMPLYLSLGSKAISYIMPSFSKQASSPTKLAEYLAMGLPVECNAGVGDVDMVMAFLKSPKDPAHEIGLIGQGVSFRSGKEIRGFSIQNFSVAIGIESYQSVLVSLGKLQAGT